jgi:hypothetical protein
MENRAGGIHRRSAKPSVVIIRVTDRVYLHVMLQQSTRRDACGYELIVSHRHDSS